ncbi:MAG: transcriptional repressor [Candidatus Riflebacteria bacterium]|nr:transcriptional repressor [Candidatus Riflebacteria bacterium]
MTTLSGQLGKDLQRGGYRLTASRKIILDIFRYGSRPLSAEDIYLAIRAENKNVGLTTIYRALDSLVKANIVRKFAVNTERALYELAGKQACEHHHHLVCRKCDLLIDYKDFCEEEVRLIKRIEELVAKRHSFEIHDHQLSFVGICNRCQKEKK